MEHRTFAKMVRSFSLHTSPATKAHGSPSRDGGIFLAVCIPPPPMPPVLSVPLLVQLFFCFLPLSLAPRSSSSLLSNHITLLSDDERVAWIPFPEQQAQSAQKNWEAQARTNSILAGSLKALEERVDDCATLLDWYVVVSSQNIIDSASPENKLSHLTHVFFNLSHARASLFSSLFSHATKLQLVCDPCPPRVASAAAHGSLEFARMYVFRVCARSDTLTLALTLTLEPPRPSPCVLF